MMTESLDQAFDKANSQRIIPWSILLIEAMIIQIRFELIFETEKLEPGYYTGKYNRPLFVVRKQAKVEHFMQWILQKTPEVKNGDRLWKALHEETMDCLTLNRYVCLVVWGKGDVKERIGIMELRAMINESYVDCYEHSSSRYTKMETLTNHFPSHRREVLLG
jgi:hypothetical protein